MLKKITKKEFIETLCNHTSVLCGAPFRRSDQEIVTALEKIESIPNNIERRTVTERHAQFIVFSNGSRLDFNQVGQYDYFTRTNGNGMTFVIQRLSYYNKFDNTDYMDYVVYAIVA